MLDRLDHNRVTLLSLSTRPVEVCQVLYRFAFLHSTLAFFAFLHSAICLKLKKKDITILKGFFIVYGTLGKWRATGGIRHAGSVSLPVKPDYFVKKFCVKTVIFIFMFCVDNNMAWCILLA